ncbi:MAG: DUF1569 domain-containing protein [Planctomycetota bacterium]|nr:DUF1569 domain-containing protein [Planctomycetota bacterium]
MNQPTEPERRPLTYSKMSGILEDAEQLAKGAYRTTGEWSFGQILWHLGYSIEGSFIGFSFKAPLLARLVIAPFIKKKTLTQPMKPGFKLGPSAAVMIPSTDVSTEDGLAKLRDAIRRFESASPNQAHPFFGKMTSDEWVLLHLRHAELHLSFVWPA